ncbi:hypothetical protein GO290_05212 [Ralstonia solanacearum]|nr:hypothetical protein [Ralstonia solanacearum]
MRARHRLHTRLHGRRHPRSLRRTHRAVRIQLRNDTVDVADLPPNVRRIGREHEAAVGLPLLPRRARPAVLDRLPRRRHLRRALLVDDGGVARQRAVRTQRAGIADRAVGQQLKRLARDDAAARFDPAVALRQVHLRHQRAHHRACAAQAVRVRHLLRHVPQHRLVQRGQLLRRQGPAQLDVVRLRVVDGVLVQDQLLLIVHRQVGLAVVRQAVDEARAAGLREGGLVQALVLGLRVVVERCAAGAQVGRQRVDQRLRADAAQHCRGGAVRQVLRRGAGRRRRAHRRAIERRIEMPCHRAAALGRHDDGVELPAPIRGARVGRVRYALLHNRGRTAEGVRRPRHRQLRIGGTDRAQAHHLPAAGGRRRLDRRVGDAVGDRRARERNRRTLDVAAIDDGAARADGQVAAAHV